MTKSAHFGSNSSFGLSKAILVYSDVLMAVHLTSTPVRLSPSTF